MGFQPRTLNQIKFRAQRTFDGFLVSKTEREQAATLLKLVEVLELCNLWADMGRISNIKELRLKTEVVMARPVEPRAAC
jgi:hypothetical protein